MSTERLSEEYMSQLCDSNVELLSRVEDILFDEQGRICSRRGETPVKNLDDYDPFVLMQLGQISQRRTTR